jgi:hypothetical protein
VLIPAASSECLGGAAIKGETKWQQMRCGNLLWLKEIHYFDFELGTPVFR